MGRPEFNEKFTNKILKDATGKSFSELQNIASNDVQSGFFKNEYLASIKNQVAKIITANFLKSENAIMKFFWKGDDTPIGDYKLIRQTLLATRDVYSDKLDVNEHHNVNVKENVLWTVFKDVYKVSLSAEIVGAAFNSMSDMATFIAHYWNSVAHSINITWLDRNRALIENHPLVYKLQSDVKDGVAVAKELWNLLKVMGMVSDKFNLEGIPSSSEGKDLLMVLSAGIQQEIQFGAVGGIYNFNNITDSGMVGGMSTYNFSDSKTYGFIGSEYSYWLDFRLNETTTQEWAATLIKDQFTHQWVRAGRIGFANGVRIVSKDFNEDHIDFRKSPLTHINEEGEVVKDDAKIIDITDFVLKGTISYEEYVPIAIKNLIPNDLNFKGAGDIPTKEEVIKALEDNNPKIKGDKLTISNITANGARITPSKPYVVSGGRNSIDIRYSYSKKPA